MTPKDEIDSSVNLKDIVGKRSCLLERKNNILFYTEDKGSLWHIM